MKTIFYYKVVSVKKGNKRLIRRSAMANKLRGKSVRYYLDRAAKPKFEGTKLLVFDCELEAKIFRMKNDHKRKFRMEIWKVQVENPRRIDRMVIPREVCGMSKNKLSMVWSYILTRLTIYPAYRVAECLFSAPAGTYACDSVTLLEKVA